MQQHNVSSSLDHILTVLRSDRWLVHHRLQELGIHSTCYQDGTFEVEINSPTTVVQLHSVLSQFTAPRQQLIERLQRCWHAM